MSQPLTDAEVHRARRGAVVLCGGASERMGQDKGWMPFGEETMLQRVVRLLGEAVPLRNIVVVAAAEQALPELRPGVRVIRDAEKSRGPLPAIIAGLDELLRLDIQAAFVTACDAPLLKPAVVDWLFERLSHSDMPQAERDCEAVIPAESSRLYPMAGVYDTMCCAAFSAAMTFNEATASNSSVQGALRSGFIRVERIALDELRAVDPALDTLQNCNTPEEYQSALERAGRQVLPKDS